MTRREYIDGLAQKLERAFLNQRMPYFPDLETGLEREVTCADVLRASLVASSYIREEAIEALSRG